MPDSVPSNMVSASSPAPAAPLAPTLDSVTFDKLTAMLVIIMPFKDINGDDLTTLTNIKVFFGPAGAILSAAAPVEFPGSYLPRSQQTVGVPVPAFGTIYDFEVEVSN